VVDRPGQHSRQLCGADATFQRRQLGLRLGDDGLVALGGAELEQHGGVLDVPRQLLDVGDLLLDAGPLAGDGLRLLLVVPEAGRQRQLFEAVDLRLQPGEVKDAPLAS
jgi:hypothetical protein